MFSKKDSKMLNWVQENWPKSTIFLALFSLIFIFLFVWEKSFALFLIWIQLPIQLPIYWLYQFEEYIYPGGFLESFNRDMLGSKQKEWPLSKWESLWINIPIIYIAFPVSAIFATLISPAFGIWMAYFSILNALSHVGMFVHSRYNPGFVVSLFLNIPVGILTIAYFFQAKVISFQAHVTGLCVAIAFQGGIMVWGLKFMKSKVKAER